MKRLFIIGAFLTLSLCYSQIPTIPQKTVANTLVSEFQTKNHLTELECPGPYMLQLAEMNAAAATCLEMNRGTFPFAIGFSLHMVNENAVKIEEGEDFSLYALSDGYGLYTMYTTDRIAVFALLEPAVIY